MVVAAHATPLTATNAASIASSRSIVLLIPSIPSLAGRRGKVLDPRSACSVNDCTIRPGTRRRDPPNYTSSRLPHTTSENVALPRSGGPSLEGARIRLAGIIGIGPGLCRTVHVDFVELPFPDVGRIACSGAVSLRAPQPQGEDQGLKVGDLQVGLGLRRRGRTEAPLSGPPVDPGGIEPHPLAGTWSWKRLSATCSIFLGATPILSRASSKLLGEGL